MSKPINAPPRLIRAALGSVGLEFVPPRAVLELVICVDPEGARLRALADYLLLVDRFYGRQDVRGLRSYAQRPQDQLEIREVRAGSIEMIIREGLDFVRPDHILITWILLRGLPHAGRIMAHTFREYAGAYYHYESARLARAQRQDLETRREATRNEVRHTRAAMRAFLEADPRLAQIQRNQRAELARLLADAYLAEEEQVRSVRVFAEEHVRDVLLRLNEQDL